MVENKTKPTKVRVSSYVAALPDATRRTDAKVIVRMMQQATGEKPMMWGPSIIGFGQVHYAYESGREGDMPLLGFSPRSTGLVLYVLTGFPGEKALLTKLGKHSTGKVCLYVKKLADVDRKVLEEIIAKAMAHMRVKYPK